MAYKILQLLWLLIKLVVRDNSYDVINFFSIIIFTHFKTYDLWRQNRVADSLRWQFLKEAIKMNFVDLHSFQIRLQ